ncbi:hypothetical protein BP5796_09549 [Coleophoma crateriformis]|uniref:Uncharacterized protein n=1 Tax=Coleophoma crateriformis TaxID=565419 RepID=A0A3D8QYQ2_9HELO|nr:hypothetical protein BP5796_09549 [Coleophoma crateriformis]
MGGVNTTDFINTKNRFTTYESRFIDKRAVPGVAACETSTNLKQCSLVSHWNDLTETNVMYLYNNRCEIIGGPTVPIPTSQAPYDFNSSLPYVVVVLQWSPTGLPEFLYAGAYFGWRHGFYRGYLLDDVYSYIAYFGC